jgi:hypothetical protein
VKTAEHWLKQPYYNDSKTLFESLPQWCESADTANQFSQSNAMILI